MEWQEFIIKINKIKWLEKHNVPKPVLYISNDTWWKIITLHVLSRKEKIENKGT